MTRAKLIIMDPQFHINRAFEDSMPIQVDLNIHIDSIFNNKAIQLTEVVLNVRISFKRRYLPITRQKNWLLAILCTAVKLAVVYVFYSVFGGIIISFV